MLIDVEGRLRRFPKGDLPDRLYRLRVASDGRTVAATTEGSFDSDGGGRVPAGVLTFDLPTGKVLGRWTPPTYLDGLAWTSSGRLMVRSGYSDGRGQPSNLGRVVLLDRSLREIGEMPGAPGVEFGAIGESAVFWDEAPLGIVSTGASTSVAGDLALAPAGELVALSSGTFEGGGAANDMPLLDSAEPSTDRASLGIAAVLAAAALAAGAWRAAWGRSPR